MGLTLLLTLFVSCSKPVKVSHIIVAAPFSADSAYRYIDEQVSFGARVPGYVAHEECYHYLVEQLQRFGADVQTQQGTMINYAGELQTVVNIVAHLRPDSGESAANVGSVRPVLLCAHWDWRPWADEEEEYSARMSPVLGANDAASGVGVLLEVARQWKINNYSVPLDIVLFDCEDMGTPDFYTGPQREDTWCLGSQLWAQSIGRRAKYKYGVLLDMVASPDAVFYREAYSDKYASDVVDDIWRTAAALGYGRFFKNERSYPITDDHYYVNSIAHIPCVDVIHYDPHVGGGFPNYWHTDNDDMSNVSVTTLDAVGKTLVTFLLQ